MKTDELLDIYSDYLISQNHYATATGLSLLVDGQISHDKITRFLNKNQFGSKELWQYVKSDIRRYEQEKGGVLIIDDTIEEKPYTDENGIVCWHFSHTKGQHVKGINLLSCLIRYEDKAFPIGFETVCKDLYFSDIKTKQTRRKSSITKNEQFRALVEQAITNQIKFDYVLADSWFGAKDNMEFIHYQKQKKFIFAIKANRLIASSKEDRKKSRYESLKTLDLKDGEKRIAYLKDIAFPVLITKKIFKNEDGSTGTLYLVTNDLESESDTIYLIYQKRWCIEEYHKSIKQNASLEKSPTKVATSQGNHIFASIIAYCKLELLKVKAHINHFALKYKLIVRANQIAFQELKNLKSSYGCVT